MTTAEQTTDPYAIGQAAANRALDVSPLTLADLIQNATAGLAAARSLWVVDLWRGTLDTLIDYQTQRSDT